MEVIDVTLRELRSEGRASRGIGGNVHEEDLGRFMRELNPEELASFTHQALSDYDISLDELFQQARERQTTRFDSRRGWLSSLAGWARVLVTSLASTPGLTNTNAATMTSAPIANVSTCHDCVICKDPICDLEIRVPCGHYYDTTCITNFFQLATQDESLFPPRCCRRKIPFEQVKPHLSQTLVRTFQQKEIEFKTPNRVYCSSPTCNRFLGPLSENADKVYTCHAPGCKRRTCAKCRGKHSTNWMQALLRAHVCCPDASIAQVLEFGRDAGWARCPGCSHMVERSEGCRHMTCRCGTEFCYLCSVQWDTCRCQGASRMALLRRRLRRVVRR